MLNIRTVLHPVHGECLYADNGIIEIGVPLSFGIRIAHFSFVGKKNVFFVQPKDMEFVIGKHGFRLRGGHRLWLAPESESDYYADNEPIEYEIVGDTVRLTQKRDPLLNVIKSIEVTLSDNKVKVTHRVFNNGKKIKASLWALTVMAGGGVTTIPLPERTGGFDPLIRVTAWDYTDLSDKRIEFGKNEIKIRQGKGERNLKIGVGHPAGAIVYENGDTVFKKHIPLYKGKNYPDGGTSFETFVCDVMTEIEGLSPLKTLLPNRTATYTEIWELCRKS